jgi:hypothetical protein
MASMSGFEKIEAEYATAPRYAAVIEWTRGGGWRLALGFGITVWGIVATRLFLS